MAYSSIVKPTDYFNTLLYTGTGSENAITGVGFQPDWVWLKSRSQVKNHFLQDAVRGITYQLRSSANNAENNYSQYVKSIQSDGFTLGTDADINNNGSTYVAWNWLGANGTASNSNGSITSTVSANTTAGFSIVSYTGNGSAGSTVGHGLGATPACIIVKNRDQTDKWSVFHQSLANGANSYIELDQTGAASNLSLSPPYWGTPSSTTFGGLHYDSTNASGEKYIAYCFAEKQGYSKFGIYTGNGNANGPFVHTGFKPAFLIFKSSTSTQNWHVLDNKRDTHNPVDLFMWPNLTDGDYAETQGVDFLSNGFKIKESGTFANGSGASYIYIAFAENPFVGNDSGTAVPVVAS